MEGALLSRLGGAWHCPLIASLPPAEPCSEGMHAGCGGEHTVTQEDPFWNLDIVFVKLLSAVFGANYF